MRRSTTSSLPGLFAGCGGPIVVPEAPQAEAATGSGAATDSAVNTDLQV